MLTLSVHLSAQCPDFDVNIRSQSQVDSFIIEYPNCTELNHNLSIADQEGGLTNLDGLRNLVRVNGRVQIENCMALESIEGLSGITHIYGRLVLSKIKEGLDYSSLENLDYNMAAFLVKDVGAEPNFHFPRIDTLIRIDFISNDQLFVLKGFDNLKCIKSCVINGDVDLTKLVNIEEIEWLIIFNNSLVDDLSQFSELSLDSIEFLSVFDSPHFSLNGIENFEYVERISALNIVDFTMEGIRNVGAKSVGVSNIGTLNNIEALNNSSVERLGLDLVRNLENLGTEMHLPNLKSLSIENNDLLNDISALSFPVDSFENLKISGNESLSDCAIEPICDVIDLETVEVDIESNATQCNSREEIIANCLISSTSSNNDLDVHLWPNPVSTYLNIDAGEGLDYHIYDVNHSLQKIGRIDNNRIYLGDLNDGMYILRLSDDASESFVRLVKQ